MPVPTQWAGKQWVINIPKVKRLFRNLRNNNCVFTEPTESACYGTLASTLMCITVMVT